MAFLLCLPDEVLIQILQYLSLPDLLNARLVCERFGTLGCDRALLDVNIFDGISLEKLDELLCLKPILKNVWELPLTKVGNQTLFSLEDHFEPIKMYCCNLLELSLSDLIIEKGISVDDLPPSICSLSLKSVTFESDDDFFSCGTKYSKMELDELCIEETRFSCFSFLGCFGPSLRFLYLKHIEGFDQMHFNLLKSKLQQLETLEIDSKYVLGCDILRVIGTFKNLNFLLLEDPSGLNQWTIKRLKDLRGLDLLDTLSIENLDLSEDNLDEMPIFPCLKHATFTFTFLKNELCLMIVKMFPVLSTIALLARFDNQDLPFALLQSLGAHPTLDYLYFSYFHILPPGQDLVVIHPPSKIRTLRFYYCSFENNVALSIGRYFTKVTHLGIGLVDYSPSVTQMITGMKQLLTVDFDGGGITDVFLESFVPALPKTVGSVWLNDEESETAFGDRSMKTIANHIPLLKYLTVESRNVTWDGFVELVRLKNLVKLDLKSTCINADQMQAFKALLPCVNFKEA